MRFLRRNKGLKKFTIAMLLTAVAVFGQARPAFEVATVRPSAPPDEARFEAAVAASGKSPLGVNVGARRAEYRYMSLKSLIATAYGVKAYQISGPEWLGEQRFDVVAALPEGAAKADAVKMLQTLLEERFRLTTHRMTTERPVLALVAAGKGETRMKTSVSKPVAIDATSPMKPGETLVDKGDGPMILRVDAATGRQVVDMGLLGRMASRMNPARQSLEIEFRMVTMPGLAQLLTQLFTSLGSLTDGLVVVDQTGLAGNYDLSLQVSMEDAIGDGSEPPGPGALVEAVQTAGLRMVAGYATVEQLVVDDAERMPPDN